jgi:uncharacterized coiled-coil protein SlyX
MPIEKEKIEPPSVLIEGISKPPEYKKERTTNINVKLSTDIAKSLSMELSTTVRDIAESLHAPVRVFVTDFSKSSSVKMLVINGVYDSEAIKKDIMSIALKLAPTTDHAKVNAIVEEKLKLCNGFAVLGEETEKIPDKEEKKKRQNVLLSYDFEKEGIEGLRRLAEEWGYKEQFEAAVSAAVQNAMQDFVIDRAQEMVRLMNERLREMEEKRGEEKEEGKEDEKEKWENETLIEEKGNLEGLVSDVKNGKMSAEEAKGEMDEIIARVVSASDNVREKVGAAE